MGGGILNGNMTTSLTCYEGEEGGRGGVGWVQA